MRMQIQMQMQAKKVRRSCEEMAQSREMKKAKNRLSTIYFPSFFLSPAKHDSLWLQKLHNGSIVISIGGGHPVGPQPLW